MGLQNGVKCLASIKNIPLVGLMQILHHFSKNNDSNAQRPILDFDINWILMNKTKATDSIKAKVDKVVDILVSFSKCSVACFPICDPKERHHSKRASVQRCTDHLILEIKVKHARYHLTQVN